ncbi:NAD-dependent epimerase/dehydratase family protein [Agromyces fucosus]|uniref:NAD-dependent epimerase/dehydratase family protein n=1 Tax=Agromyces fucosus TaxID=41985 RepID=A0A4Q2JLX5_9MICO|nr:MULTISPECIES: NAD(P)H-binding protein [Agromyces]RXZ47609.1 NAD-dependent epimerase/dehydratase family protein [Agromyces fucosus]
MRIAVLGASGRTGGLIVDAARARGHEVVAVVRRAASAPSGVIERIAEGRDVDALTAALDGADAAVFAIGPTAASTDHTVMRESMPALVKAMRSADVRRLVVVSASGPFTDGDDPFLKFVAKPIVQRILREPFSDFVATEPVVRSSALDWTIVRPPQLKDGDARGRYRRANGGGVPFGISIRRADLAAAVLDVLDDDGTVGSTITVAA